MKNYYKTMGVYWASSLLVDIVGFFRLKRMDWALWIFWLLSLVLSAGEGFAFYYAKKYHNNTPVYNIVEILELLLLCLYFNYSVALFQKRHIGVIIGLVSSTVGVAKLFLWADYWVMDTYLIIYHDLLIIALAMTSLVQLYLSGNYIRLRTAPHFYLALILILSGSMSFFHWVLYDYFTEVMPHYKWLIDSSLTINGLIANIAVAAVFFSLPNRKRYG